MNTITIEASEPIATEEIMSKRKRRAARKDRWRFWQWRLWRSKWFLIPASVVGVLLLIIGVWSLLFVPPMLAQAREVEARVESLKAAAKDQDLSVIKRELPELRHDLTALQLQVKRHGYLGAIPLIGHYYHDAQAVFAAADSGLEGGEILVEAMEPYGPVFGFKTDAAEAQADKPNDEKIADMIMLMPAILPSLDEAIVHFDETSQHIASIEASRYPGKVPFIDFNVRATLEEAQSQVESAVDGIHQARPVLDVLPSVLGAEQSKRYLLIFQNDKELRPTGGFISSTAYVTFRGGKFEVTDSNDIYELDKNESYGPAPVPMQLYNNAKGWHMRDTNWSPDFAESMKDFTYYYDRSGHLPVDGFIALDTQFVEELMRITGPVTVDGYGEFTAEPIDVNGVPVPKVVYDLEIIAQKSGLGNDSRKSVIGDLMKKLIEVIFAEPVTRWPDYFELAMKMGQEKHVLLNFYDTEAQALAEDNNFAGRMVETEAPVDYLHINDANLAGLKTNFYLQQQTKQDVEIAGDGTVTKTLTITYTNTGAFDGWISATARNYTRVYVPLGSKLIEASGGEQRVDVVEELGKTVFDNFVRIKPLESQTMVFTYELPFKVTGDEYELLMQKQAGAQNWKIATSVNGGGVDEVVLERDVTIKLPVK